MITFMLTKNKVKASIPKITEENLDKYIQPLNNTLQRFQITTNNRIAAFLAQTAHESTNYSVVKENLNYSAQGLLKIFPKYFNQENVHLYARQPEKIANKVYANRLGNGNEASGDGWKYRGRGIIQLTGKANYKACSDFLQVDFVAKPELVEQPEYAVLTAGWFWFKNNLNVLADKADEESFTRLTEKINGGTIGLEERINNWKLSKLALNV